jgi:phosphate transport system substrate-binding protein
MKQAPIFAATFAVLVAGCQDAPPSPALDRATPVKLQGRGASFPKPLYATWTTEYRNVDPATQIDYDPAGSGAGAKAILSHGVDFGASDVPLSNDQMAQADRALLHVPMTLGAVAITYNGNGLPSHLHLTPEALAGMLLGDVKKWNDPVIAMVNPDVKLPDTPVSVAFRSDSSGTSYVLGDYLSKVSKRWRDVVGAPSTTLVLPKTIAALPAEKNDGVAKRVSETQGAIGYVDFAHAREQKLSVADLRNQVGRFVAPSLEAIAASGAACELGDDLRASLTDAPGEASYPIASFTYIIVYEQASDPLAGLRLARFLWWATHDGQKFGPSLGYATLPSEVVVRVETRLHRMATAKGQPLLVVN